ncbi:hypothetical protein ACPPVS_10930 [Cellulomonas sp. McL0617]|uniref:hypothetical protein n=1 Tax=Cellulomonas sp. McL0617 TaxID=3415675 RepID=UPI003CF6D85D
MVENTPTPRKPRSTSAAGRTPRRPAKPPVVPDEATEEPVVEEPVLDEAVVGAPPVAEPVVGEPSPSIADEISADETAEPDAVEPGVDGPDLVEPVASEVVAEEPAVHDTEPILVSEVADVADVAEETDTLNDTVPIVVAVPTETVPGDTEEDPAELMARLKALEAENAALRVATVSEPGVGRKRKPGRTTLAIVLILIGALLAPVAVVGKWARDLVVDTDDYVATVGPIVDDPGVQAAVTNRVTTAVVDALNLDQLTTQATDALSSLNLPPLVSTGLASLQGPLQDAITGFVHKQVARVVTSDAFAATWKQANRTAHEQIVATLRGDPDALAQISSSGELVIDITPVIEQVKQQLVDAGFTLAGRIPTITVTFPVASSSDLVRLQNAYRLIDVAGAVLPWLSLLLLAGGVLAAQRRSRALVIAGLSLAAGMAVLAVGLAIGRWFYTNSLPPAVQRPDVAVTLYDQFISLLRIELRVFLVLGLLVAIIAFLAGGTTAARSVRETSGKGVAWARGLGDQHGVGTGAFGVWLYQQRTLIRVVVIGLAILVLVLADNLTGKAVLTVAVVALLILGVVTLLARPPHEEPVAEPLALP